MANRRNRYKTMERYMTAALIGDLLLFILYMIFAGLGIIWMKVILTVLVIAISGLCIVYLYLSQELLRPRSLWMTVSAISILFCLFFSLILNFPSPA